MKLLPSALALVTLGAAMAASSTVSSMPLLPKATAEAAPFVTEAAYWRTWTTVEARAASGVTTKLLAYYFACAVGGDGPPLVSATASHGRIAVKNGVVKGCGQTRPAVELWYTSEPGFHGLDEVMVVAPVYQAIDVTVR